MNENWVKVDQAANIPLNCAKIIQSGPEVIAVFRMEEGYRAVDNSCPHRGGFLGEGELRGTLVTCPLHAWQFDVVTGECPHIPGEKIKTYEVKVENDEVFVKL